MKKPFQIIGLTLLIVALPAASWYFLKSGLDYRKASMGLLDDHGPLPDATIQLYDGDEVHTSRFRDQLVLTYLEDVGADTVQIMKLYRQFQKRSDLHFLIHANERFRLLEERNSNLWMLEDGVENIDFINAMGLSGKKGTVALVDITGTIKNYYQFSDLDNIRQLVEHTAFLLPIEETAKPEMIRTNEK